MSGNTKTGSRVPAECSGFPWLEEVPIYKILIALALLVLLAYANSLHGEFVFDDTKQILNNPTLRGPVHLFQAFTTDVWAFQKSYSTDIPPPYYRPMFTLWLDLGYRLFKLWPPGWHLLSVLLHVIATGMMFLLILEVTGRKSLSTLAALLFAVHPIHSESVSWVSAVPDLQLAVLFLPALYFYFRARMTGQTWHWIWAFFFYALSTLCKENALSLPLIVLGMEWLGAAGPVDLYKRRLFQISNIRAALTRASGFIAISLLYLWARFEVLGLITWKHPFDKDLTNLEAWISVPHVCLTYLLHLLFPYDLSLFYDITFVRSAASTDFLIPVLVLGGILGVWLWYWKRLWVSDWQAADCFLFASLLLLGPMVPVLNLKAFHEEYLVQDRYMYLPSIGFCVLAAMALLAIGKSVREVRIRNAVIGGIVALLLLGSVLQNRVWSDSISLWTRARDHRPYSWHAHYNLGLAFLLHQRYSEAEGELQIAARYAPGNPLVFNNLGLAEVQLNQNEMALQSFDRAIQLNPQMADAYVNLGDVQYREKDVVRAKGNFRRALELNPRLASALFNLARLDMDQGDFRAAEGEWKKLLDLDPDDAEARWHLGKTLKSLGKADKARTQWIRALQDARSEELRRVIESELASIN